MHSRKLLLGLVFICAFVLLFLVRRSEGAKAKPDPGCWRTLDYTEYGDGKGKPPLKASACKNMTVGRGKSCWTSDGKQWNKATTTDCTNWMKKIDWKSSSVRDASRLKAKGYKKYDQKNYAGTNKYIKQIKDATADKCKNECDGMSECTGFAFTKKGGSDKQCYLIDAERTNGALSGDKNWVTFVKEGSITGGTSATGGNEGSQGNCTGKDQVVVYEHEKYGGTSKQLECNKSYQGSDLPLYDVYREPIGFGLGRLQQYKDHPVSKTTSMKIPIGMKAYIKNHEGKTHTYFGDQENIGKDWSDRIAQIVSQPCNQEDYDKNWCKKPSA